MRLILVILAALMMIPLPCGAQQSMSASFHNYLVSQGIPIVGVSLTVDPPTDGGNSLYGTVNE